jgi:hypothetical protein
VSADRTMSNKSEFVVEEMVERLIARHGYYFAIDELLSALDTLARISLADPLNRISERELRTWTRAIEDAIKRHIDENTFEKQISESDPLRARGMGVRLD